MYEYGAYISLFKNIAPKTKYYGSVKNLTDRFSVFSQNISFCPI